MKKEIEISNINGKSLKGHCESIKNRTIIFIPHVIEENRTSIVEEFWHGCALPGIKRIHICVNDNEIKLSSIKLYPPKANNLKLELCNDSDLLYFS